MNSEKPERCMKTSKTSRRHPMRCVHCGELALELTACHACGSLEGFVVRISKAARRETLAVRDRLDAAFSARSMPRV